MLQPVGHRLRCYQDLWEARMIHRQIGSERAKRRWLAAVFVHSASRGAISPQLSVPQKIVGAFLLLAHVGIESDRSGRRTLRGLFRTSDGNEPVKQRIFRIF